MADERFPIPEEDFLRAAALLLAEEGARSEVRILASSPAKIDLWKYDNWDGGQYEWRIDFSIPMQSFRLLSDDDRASMEARIKAAMGKVLVSYDNHYVDVAITMVIPKADPDWRQKAGRWALGDDLSNQGRARSDNLAPLQHDGLLFRSNPEILLYTAFKSLGVAVAPLPVFVRGGQRFKRIEPDFVLVHSGAMMVVEVDGGFHQESPAEAHERLAMLTREGVKMERVFASDCDTAEKARECARKLFEILKRQAAMR